MSNPILLLILIPAIVMFVRFVLIPRIRMERRAHAFLAQHPDAERTSVYLPFRSAWASGKRQEMAAKVSEMSNVGWSFLRATEASPLWTLCSWRGGVTLHFIREQATAELQTKQVG